MLEIIELREKITERMDEGVSLDQVETELIEREDHLGDEEKAALWLFAWSLVPLARQPSTAPQLSGLSAGMSPPDSAGVRLGGGRSRRALAR